MRISLLLYLHRRDIPHWKFADYSPDPDPDQLFLFGHVSSHQKFDIPFPRHGDSGMLLLQLICDFGKHHGTRTHIISYDKMSNNFSVHLHIF